MPDASICPNKKPLPFPFFLMQANWIFYYPKMHFWVSETQNGHSNLKAETWYYFDFLLKLRIFSFKWYHPLLWTVYISQKKWKETWGSRNPSLAPRLLFYTMGSNNFWVCPYFLNIHQWNGVRWVFLKIAGIWKNK